MRNDVAFLQSLGLMDYSLLIAIEKSLNPKEYLHIEKELVLRDTIQMNHSFLLMDLSERKKRLESIKKTNELEKMKKIAIGNWMSERHRF